MQLTLQPSLSLIAFLCSISLLSASQVKTLRTPDDGIQPQAAIDDRGTIHLIYYKGPPMGGDVHYTTLDPKSESFSKSIQVNSKPGSATAMGTIRGAQLAVGKNGRVHVVWNGRSPDKNHENAPLLYTRLNNQKTAFEPERNMITYAAGLDGGSSVAADINGNVYVAWHAHNPGKPAGELGRAIFVSRSSDDGQNFSREEPVSQPDAGVCPCCGMRAFADRTGQIYVLYRAAFDAMNRDAVILAGKDKSFRRIQSHPWKIASCPMSSAALTQNSAHTYAAWETAGNVFFAPVSLDSQTPSAPISPPGSGQRKHPTIAANSKGEVLLAWTQGTGWQKGGTLEWQLFDQNLNPTSKHSAQLNVPVWGLVTAVAAPDGKFIVIH